MLSPKSSPLGKLLSRYVCVRIIRMDAVDIGLFDRDWNNAIYFFVLNSDEQVYMRYGGRDARSPDTYLNLQSLELALEKGLELHRDYAEGRFAASPRPAPRFPGEIPPLVERTTARGRCVECHLIGDYMNVQRELEGKLDKLTHLFRSPDIRNLGIDLDIPKGLVVREARDPAATAGIRPGDRIARIEGNSVWTFGDLQYRYDQVRRDAQQLSVTVVRGTDTVQVVIPLPRLWWWTDITFRQSTVDPQVQFDSRPLTDEEKKRNGLDPAGFASVVTRVDMLAKVRKSHDLREGDIVFSVDRVTADPFADRAELYIKLRKTAGDAVTLGVIRSGRRLETTLKTLRMSFRK